MGKTKFIFIIFLILSGLFLFSSCKQKKETSQTILETQTEHVDENQTITEIRTNSTKERTFRSEHPVLFSIIIFSILLTIVIVAFIVKSTVSDFSNISDNVSSAINIFNKFGNLKKK